MERKTINRYWLAATWFVALVLLVGVGMVFMNEAIRSQFTESEPAKGLASLGAEMGTVALLSIVAGLAAGAVFGRRRRLDELHVDRMYPLK